MAALDVLPWDLFNYGKARLEKNKTAAQLRSECQLRSIEVSSSADKDECVKKLLDWKRRSQNAPTSVDPNVNTADAKDFQTVSQIGPKIAEAILNEREKGSFSDMDDFEERVKRIPKLTDTVYQNLVNAGFNATAPRVEEEGRPAAEEGDDERLADEFGGLGLEDDGGERSAAEKDDDEGLADELGGLGLEDDGRGSAAEKDDDEGLEDEVGVNGDTEGVRTGKKAVRLECPNFKACAEFVASLGLHERTFDTKANVCYCAACSHRHVDVAKRGTRKYALPKGWCGFGLAIDSNYFERENVFQDWDVAFHGTKKVTAVEILKSDWQLLLPGDKTQTGYTIPIREGHIKGARGRDNLFTGKREQFEPRQVFTSPSILYCAYRQVYCDVTTFNGNRFKVAFQLRQKPNTYAIGQQTVSRSLRAEEKIDPHFENSELEYYTQNRGVHKLTRLMVQLLD